jgi:hypothetical protein
MNSALRAVGNDRCHSLGSKKRYGDEAFGEALRFDLDSNGGKARLVFRDSGQSPGSCDMRSLRDLSKARVLRLLAKRERNCLPIFCLTALY